MKYFYSLIASLALLLAASCSSDNSLHTYVNYSIQKIVKTTDGSDSTITVKSLKSGEPYIMAVTCITEEGTLARLVVESKLTEEPDRRPLIEEELSGQNRTFNVDFIAPQTTKDSTMVRIFARIETTAGAQDVREKMFSIVGTDSQLAEQAGLTLYAQEADQHPNAISIMNGEESTGKLKFIMASLADEENVDVLFPMLDDSEECSCTLISPNRKVEFARINTFNYGAATTQGLINAYAASITAPSVKGLADDDTVLFGANGRAIGVIKIQKIYDEPGTKSDRIYFSAKML